MPARHLALTCLLLIAAAFLGGCRTTGSQETPSDRGGQVHQERESDRDPAPARPAGMPVQDGPWSFSAWTSGGYVFGGDVEGTDDAIDVAIAGVGVTARGGAWRGSQLTFALDFEHRYYDFDFGVAEPFFGTTGDQEIGFNSLGATATLLQAFDRNWGALVQVGVRGSAEVQADLTDGVSWRVLAGAGYRFSNDLQVGLGVAVLGRLEEDVLIVPAIQMRWQIDEDWRFVIEGPGAALSWTPAEDWELVLGARWNSRRYRLDDDPNTNEGIFEDQRIPVSLTVRHDLDDTWQVEGSLGVDVYRRFASEDDDGRRLTGRDADVGWFAGLGVTATF